MCFIVSIILLILSFNFYNAGELLLAFGAFVISMFFVYFMVKNILYIKKLKGGKKDDN